MEAEPAKLIRLKVNLNAETAAALLELSESTEQNITDVLHQAIAVLNFMVNEENKGRKIQTMNQNGKKKKEIYLM